MKTAFADALTSRAWYSSDETFPFSTGVSQMGHLLLGLAEAGVKIENLDCGYVSWRFFECNENVLAKMGSAFSSLKKLSLSFSTGTPNDYDNDAEPNCMQNSPRENRRSSQLHYISISLKTSSCYSAELSDTAIDFKHIVGNFTWPFLTKFDF